MDQQQQEVIVKKQKTKKFYQRWWFWLIVVVVGVIIVSSNSGDDSSDGINKDAIESTSVAVSKTTVSSEVTTSPKITEPETTADEYKALCQSYTYDELARNPDSYRNKMITFRGEVVQVIENGRKIALRVYMNGEYNDIVYVTYTLKSGEGRILEDDVLKIYGSFKGLKTYTTVLGAEVTVPYVEAMYVERVS